MKIAAIIAVLAVAASGCAHRRAAEVAPRTAALQPAIPVARVHFATGSDAVPAAERVAIGANARWMAAHPGVLVLLEGHADERGSNDANLALGDRRARVVKEALAVSGAGGEERIAVVSAGEERPIDPRHTGSAWSRNRRVEFIVHEREKP